jgi:hypothetical protein
MRMMQQGSMVTFRRPIPLLVLLAIALVAAGCVTKTAQQPEATSFRATPDIRMRVIDERKEEVIRRLANCESGGWGPSERKIYGGRGAYLGRLQFTIRTVQAYVQQRDGVQLNRQEAADLAHDYERAADLAKYMIFELEEPWHWPVCSRKTGMVAEVRSIKDGYEALNR